MTEVSNCIVCGGTICARQTALVAPFLARRIWNRRAFAVQLVECRGCGFLFYNPRLDPDEEERLYARYRSDEYQRMRQSVEPWYTPQFNRNLRRDSFFSIPKQKLWEILRDRLPSGPVSILDFGGDQGELVRELVPGAKTYVYHISGVAPVNGVERCADLEASRVQRCDLILNSNVLEHVGFPRALIGLLSSVAAPGSMAFIEVPHESPFDRKTMLKRAVQEGVLAHIRPATALSLARPGLLYVMHEHVNFFGPKSLEALMSHAGGGVTEAGVPSRYA